MRVRLTAPYTLLQVEDSGRSNQVMQGLRMVDEEKIATNVVSSIVSRIAGLAERRFREQMATWANERPAAFKALVLAQLRRANKIKNMISGGYQLNLEDVFVEPEISMAGAPTELLRIERLARDFDRIIILGPAGCGKSLLAKHLTRTLAQAGEAKLPILIELREIEALEVDSLFEIVMRTVQRDMPNFSADQLRSGLEHGLFTFVLDGMDEMSRVRSKSIRSEIINWSARYPYIRLIVTSRPQATLYGWVDFIPVKIAPFDHDRRRDLLTKFPSAPELKLRATSFVASSEASPLDPLLATPLFCLMTLLTPKIPTDMSDEAKFLDLCVSALFFSHDRSKGEYAREKGISTSDGDVLFLAACFCLSTYVAGLIEMTEVQALHHANDAIEQFRSNRSNGGTLDEAALLYELSEARSLISATTTGYTFNIRRMQEFLAGKCFHWMSNESCAMYLDRVSARWETDSVIDFARNEMGEARFWSVWLSKRVSELTEICNEAQAGARTSGVLNGLYDEFALNFRGSRCSVTYEVFLEHKCSLQSAIKILTIPSPHTCISENSATFRSRRDLVVDLLSNSKLALFVSSGMWSDFSQVMNDALSGLALRKIGRGIDGR